MTQGDFNMHVSTHLKYHHHGSYIKRQPQICSLSISYFTEEILAVSYYATYLPCLDYPGCGLVNQLVSFSAVFFGKIVVDLAGLDGGGGG